MLEEYRISCDPADMDLDAIHDFLSGSYWAEGIPKETVLRSMNHSLCFGAFAGPEQVGFARMVTDRATFAYLADVYVLEKHRGTGLGKHLMKTIMEHPQLQGLRRIMLATHDAHDLYRKFGFTDVKTTSHLLEIFVPGIYK